MLIVKVRGVPETTLNESKVRALRLASSSTSFGSLLEMELKMRSLA